MPKPTTAKNPLAARFPAASDTPSYRTIASLEGEVGTGKTHFGLSAPGPILVQNIDGGLEGVVEKFASEGKEIYDQRYVWTPGDPAEELDESTMTEKQRKALGDDLQALAREIRAKWEKDLRYAILNDIRTVLQDTESRIWQVYRYAEFGQPNADSQRDYDKLNQRFESNIILAREHNINLFMIRSMKDRWGMYGPPKPNGGKSFAKSGREVWGYEHLPGMMMTELTFLHDPKGSAAEGTDYMIKIGKCRQNPDLQFTTIPRCSFPELGEMLIEGSTQEDWA